MASRAQSDEVSVRVFATLATEFLVVNFQVHRAAAVLTSPAIPPQHLLSESFVGLGIKSQARLFG